MKNLSRLSDAEWTPAEAPKIQDDPVPERAVMGFGHLQEEWENYDALLSGCLIHDTYPKKTTWQENREQLLMALRHCEGNV